MSDRYSDRCSERYSRSLSEVKVSQSETEAETDFEVKTFLAGSALGFAAEPVSNRRSADARVSDDLDLTHEGEAR
jgi:hypothetical protein